jgi:hypothetical protein
MDKQIWWEAPNAVRIPTGILVALVLGLRVYGVYRSSKNTPKRSPKLGGLNALPPSVYGVSSL